MLTASLQQALISESLHCAIKMIDSGRTSAMLGQFLGMSAGSQMVYDLQYTTAKCHVWALPGVL